MIFPIFSSFFYCAASFLQKRLVSGHSLKKTPSAYIAIHIPIFLFSVVLLPLIFGRSVFMLPIQNAFGLILAGAVNVFALAYYLKALNAGDAMDVMIFNQTSPLFSLLLGFLVLGQKINHLQIIGFLIIMFASIIVGIFGEERKRQGKKSSRLKVAAITVFYAFFSILSDVLYLYFLGDATADYTLFVQSFLFFQLGSFLASFFCLIVFTSWRKDLAVFLTRSRNKGINCAGSFIEAFCYLCAEILYKLGLILAPALALLSVLSKIFSLFASFILNLALGQLFPKIIKVKKFTAKTFAVYLVAAVMIIFGVLVMN